jgi:hypothetical protein
VAPMREVGCRGRRAGRRVGEGGKGNGAQVALWAQRVSQASLLTKRIEKTFQKFLLHSFCDHVTVTSCQPEYGHSGVLALTGG